MKALSQLDGSSTISLVKARCKEQQIAYVHVVSRNELLVVAWPWQTVSGMQPQAAHFCSSVSCIWCTICMLASWSQLRICGHASGPQIADGMPLHLVSDHQTASADKH